MVCILSSQCILCLGYCGGFDGSGAHRGRAFLWVTIHSRVSPHFSMSIHLISSSPQPLVHCMSHWSYCGILLGSLLPVVCHFGCLSAMATLSTIPEESDGAVDLVEDTQLEAVPETQFENDYGEFASFDEPNRYDTVTPRSARVLEANRPPSSHRPAVAAEEMTFLITRPKSSGEDSPKSFQWGKHVQPKMNLSRERTQHAHLPNAPGQIDPIEQLECKSS
jgi:hypothetical protein